MNDPETILILARHLRECGWKVEVIGGPTSIHGPECIPDMFVIRFGAVHYLQAVAYDNIVKMSCHKHSQPTNGPMKAEFDLNDPESISHIEATVLAFSKRQI